MEENCTNLPVEEYRYVEPGYRYEERHLPAIYPSIFFTEEEAKKVDWDAVFRKW